MNGLSVRQTKIQGEAGASHLTLNLSVRLDGHNDKYPRLYAQKTPTTDTFPDCAFCGIRRNGIARPHRFNDGLLVSIFLYEAAGKAGLFSLRSQHRRLPYPHRG